MQITRTDTEDVVLVDGLWVELAYEGNAVNIDGLWIDTAPYNPDNLDEVRKIISSNEEIMSRLNNARAQRDMERACARKVTWSNNTITWHQEGEVSSDGIVIELGAAGSGVNIDGLWIGTATFNPNDLEEVRRIITSDFDIQLRLTQVRAQRDLALSRSRLERTTK